MENFNLNLNNVVYGRILSKAHLDANNGLSNELTAVCSMLPINLHFDRKTSLPSTFRVKIHSLTE